MTEHSFHAMPKNYGSESAIPGGMDQLRPADRVICIGTDKDTLGVQTMDGIQLITSHHGQYLLPF